MMNFSWKNLYLSKTTQSCIVFLVLRLIFKVTEFREAALGMSFALFRLHLLYHPNIIRLYQWALYDADRHGNKHVDLDTEVPRAQISGQAEFIYVLLMNPN